MYGGRPRGVHAVFKDAVELVNAGTVIFCLYVLNVMMSRPKG